MITLRIVTGRFGVLRVDSSPTVADIARLRTDVIDTFSRTQGKFVLFCDLTAVDSIAPEVRGPITQVFVSDNPRIERNALLVTRGTPIVMQIHNMVRDAGSRVRRVFTDKDELEAWLAELLTVEEKAALRKILDSI